MAGRAGASTYEFGPDPGSTIMWFGTRHQGKRFDQLPKDYRQWLVGRSKENPSSNMMKFKRLNDEYVAWLATQRSSLPGRFANDNHTDPNRKSMNQKRKRSLDDGSGFNAKIKSADTSRPGTTATSRESRPVINPTTRDSRAASRTTADALPTITTKKETENQTPQRPGRLKQTQLNFPRTPLGVMTPNKVLRTEKAPQRAPESKVRPRNSPRRVPASHGGMRSGKVADLLSTSKGHTSPSSSCETKSKPTRPSSITAGASKSTPPSAKRRKTQSQKSETVIVEASSSQSSAPSPWRPVVHLVSAER